MYRQYSTSQPPNKHTWPLLPVRVQIYYSKKSGFDISMEAQIKYNTWFAELVSLFFCVRFLPPSPTRVGKKPGVSGPEKRCICLAPLHWLPRLEALCLRRGGGGG